MRAGVRGAVVNFGTTAGPQAGLRTANDGLLSVQSDNSRLPWPQHFYDSSAGLIGVIASDSIPRIGDTLVPDMLATHSAVRLVARQRGVRSEVAPHGTPQRK